MTKNSRQKKARTMRAKWGDCLVVSYWLTVIHYYFHDIEFWLDQIVWITPIYYRCNAIK